MTRPDQSVIDFAVAPLPDGATLITFVDVTDSKRYERALIERNEALVAGRPAQEPVHQPRVLRAEDAAHQHHRLQRAADQPAHRRPQRQAARVPERHLGLVAHAAGHHQRHPRSRHHRCRRAGAEAGAGQGRRPGRHRRCSACATAPPAHASISTFASPTMPWNSSPTRPGCGRCSTICCPMPSASPSPATPSAISAWREAGMMAFAVEDQGVGIPKDEQQRVFERFESRSQGSKHRGAGLGPVDRQEPGGAARRRHVAGIGAGPRHARDGALPRGRRARSRTAEPMSADRPCMSDAVDARARRGGRGAAGRAAGAEARPRRCHRAQRRAGCRQDHVGARADRRAAAR